MNIPGNSVTVSRIGDMRCIPITFLLATGFLTSFTAAQTASLDAFQSQAELRDFILDTARRSNAAGPQPFEEHYEFIHLKITEQRNPKGELKSREVERYHHHPAGNGHHAGTPPPGARRTSATTSDKEVSRDDFQIDADMLRRFRFEPAGEETLDDRSQHVIDFQPASESLPVRSFKDKYINQTAGRLWIDAELQILTRLQMRLRQPVNVWGGLLGAIWEFEFDLERAQTPEGHWYTRQVQWHLKGRKLFASKIIDFHEKRSDVRRAAHTERTDSIEEAPARENRVPASP